MSLCRLHAHCVWRVDILVVCCLCGLPAACARVMRGKNACDIILTIAWMPPCSAKAALVLASRPCVRNRVYNVLTADALAGAVL